jgi:hypothetical protein
LKKQGWEGGEVITFFIPTVFTEYSTIPMPFLLMLLHEIGSAEFDRKHKFGRTGCGGKTHAETQYLYT